ncbi:hypothetical protein V9T40_001248 [Parthenolecanium corni]|uniref:Uncharacterized protein n=1 Tax=Parthenolecanium corni TaxID=536013 RepID=A0AAN9Y167_9HEMI
MLIPDAYMGSTGVKASSYHWVAPFACQMATNSKMTTGSQGSRTFISQDAAQPGSEMNPESPRKLEEAFQKQEPDPASKRQKEGRTLQGEIDAVYNQAVQRACSEMNRRNNDNLIFSEVLAQKLEKFTRLLPIWSAVMVPIFQYGDITESRKASEGFFNDVKHRLFQHQRFQ